MYLIIIILPLISSIICGFFGRFIGIRGVKILSCNILFLNVLISLFIYYEILINLGITNITLWEWFNIGILSNYFSFRFDFIVSNMLILVNLVSFCVHIFSTSYMKTDPHLPRFISYLSLFTFFMIILISSSNLIQLFIGWEGVGLCSYLLINFWFTRIQANKSAIKAMVINKIGDMGLLLGIILLWLISGSIEYSEIFLYFSNNNFSNLLDLSGFLILIGVIGKSAQIGLHMWLPDAMEGPTPVSALIHAATMVTAGVFLIIRLSPIFEKMQLILIIIILIGSLTAFFSATIGLAQNDIKKVIAYSTCSQLGYMIMICGFSYYHVSLFHLINHGFFKALLFLSAGSIIHAFSNEQDLRKMGGLKNFIPLTFIFIIIGSLSLMGLPFLSGFYSKDLILELIIDNNNLIFSLWLGISAAFLTALYSFRLIYFTFINNPQGEKIKIENSHESDFNLIFPLIILFILSIISGFMFQFLIINNNFPLILSNLDKFLTFRVSVIGLILSIILGVLVNINWIFKLNIIIKKFYNFSSYNWYFDLVLNNYIVKPCFNIGYYISYKLIDNQLLEKLGPNSILKILSLNSNNLSKSVSGKISVYIFFFFLFLICFILKI